LKLSSQFLAPYYRRRDIFPNLLARSTYLSKYSRNEVWTDTVRRVVESNCEADPYVTEDETERLFDAIWKGEGQPPGRGYWTGGVPGIPVDGRYNCGRATTRFFADGVIRTLGEMAGKSTRVRCIDGVWRPAEIREFGVQRLYRVTFRPDVATSRYNISYDVTREHRWITKRGEVTDLRVGDKVCIKPDHIEKTPEWSDGFIHGVMYGDGCATTGRPKHYQIRLCGAKGVLLETLLSSKWYVSHSYPASYNGDPHVRLRSNVQLNCLPDEEFSIEYQAGFLAGLLRVDGFNSGTRRGIELTDAEAIRWIEDRAPLLGWVITGGFSTHSKETNYGKRSGTPRRITLTQESMDFVVQSIEDLNIEETVYCAVEPITHTFTLVGGVPTGNCHTAALRSTDDWRWTALMLMCGGGVGISLVEIDKLPPVSSTPCRLSVIVSRSHPDWGDVNPDEVHGNFDEEVVVPDSREGWANVFKQVMDAAFAGRSVLVNVSSLRPYGAPLRTFGGHASGPGALVTLLRNAWAIIRRRAGGRLTSVDCLDITNHTGVAIRAGGARRSALIVLGHANDTEFRTAKHNWDAVLSHRSTSNNSVLFEHERQFVDFDWRAAVEDMDNYGEPGAVNLWLARKLDNYVVGVNPCGEQFLQHREACNLSEVYPAKVSGNVGDVLRLLTRYTIRQRLAAMSDPVADEVRRRNMRIGVGLGGLLDFAWTKNQLTEWYHTVRSEANSYARHLGISQPITVTTVKPSGTISLLNGSSPGLHAPYAPFYIRRTRISEVEPMAQALVDAGVPFEPCVYDSTGRTLVFSFPMKAVSPSGRYAVTETVSDQIGRLIAVQDAWADNAVSITVSFSKSEKQELALLLAARFKDSIKSVSCLPRSHGYQQPPYEQIDETTYRDMMATVNNEHPLTHGGDLEIEECAGGACPIR
jgi:ribonucleoside-triphosphate reductase (thioredoxin)